MVSLKQKAPSIDEKLAIIKKYDEEKSGKSQKAIADELVIAGSTLRTILNLGNVKRQKVRACLLYTSPSPRDRTRSRMPSSA